MRAVCWQQLRGSGEGTGHPGPVLPLSAPPGVVYMADPRMSPITQMDGIPIHMGMVGPLGAPAPQYRDRVGVLSPGAAYGPQTPSGPRGPVYMDYSAYYGRPHLMPAVPSPREALAALEGPAVSIFGRPSTFVTMPSPPHAIPCACTLWHS